MSNKTLLKHLLHVKHTVIDSSKIDEETDAVIICAHPTKAHAHNCPICGRRCSCYDNGRGLRRWRALTGDLPRYSLRLLHTHRVPGTWGAYSCSSVGKASLNIHQIL